MARDVEQEDLLRSEQAPLVTCALMRMSQSSQDLEKSIPGRAIDNCTAGLSWA